jgi:hypothetical protein
MHLRSMLPVFCAIALAAGAVARAQHAVVRNAEAAPMPKPPEHAVAPSAATVFPMPGAGQIPPRDVCAALVAFLQQTATQAQPASPPPAQQTTPAAQGQSNQAKPDQANSDKARSDDTKPVVGQTAPPVDRPQHTSGQTGPIPNGASASKPPPISLQQAQELAAGGDQRACRDAAQQMRRSGMIMPDALIALAALRSDLLPRSPAR